MSDALRLKTSNMAVHMSVPAAEDGEKRGRKASRQARQMQLIEATIDSLAKRGYSDTTLADVADGAGLSRGIVNFHFESKEKLLVATLQYMAEEYAGHWQASLDKAGNDPAVKLWALVAADFDRKICTKRKLAAWCAFWGETKSRPTYQALCGANDKAFQEVISELCIALKSEADYAYDPDLTSLGLGTMMDGLWLRLMMGDGLTRERAHNAAIDYLVSVFPRHFTKAGPKEK